MEWLDGLMVTCFGKVNVVVMSVEAWFGLLASMDLTVLTCLWLPEEFVLKRMEDERMKNFILNPGLFKDSVLALADYKWLSAVLSGFKRESDCKLIYYAFRVLAMGNQVLMHGRIVDFKAGSQWFQRALCVWEKLKAVDDQWLPFRAQREERREGRSDGQDVVQAIFTYEFEREVKRFQAAAAQVPFVHDRSDGLVCSECHDDQGMICQLANCSHQFHVECISSAVRSQYFSATRFFLNDDIGSADPCHPIAKCPVCSASVRAALEPARSENLRSAMQDRPLAGAELPPFILYDSTITWHVYWRYSRWDEAVEASEMAALRARR